MRQGLNFGLMTGCSSCAHRLAVWINSDKETRPFNILPHDPAQLCVVPEPKAAQYPHSFSDTVDTPEHVTNNPAEYSITGGSSNFLNPGNINSQSVLLRNQNYLKVMGTITE